MSLGFYQGDWSCTQVFNIELSDEVFWFIIVQFVWLSLWTAIPFTVCTCNIFCLCPLNNNTLPQSLVKLSAEWMSSSLDLDEMQSYWVFHSDPVCLHTMYMFVMSSAKKVPYVKTIILGSDQTPCILRGIWLGPTIFVTHEHLWRTFLSLLV